MQRKISRHKLIIRAEGSCALLGYNGKKARAALKGRSFIDGIAKIVSDPGSISAIEVHLGHELGFSAVRQIIAVVNTIAWHLAVKVNGKKRIGAVYAKEPNITVPAR